MLCMLLKPLCSIELSIVYHLDGSPHQADLAKLGMLLRVHSNSKRSRGGPSTPYRPYCTF